MVVGEKLNLTNKFTVFQRNYTTAAHAMQQNFTFDEYLTSPTARRLYNICLFQYGNAIVTTVTQWHNSDAPPTPVPPLLHTAVKNPDNCVVGFLRRPGCQPEFPIITSLFSLRQSSTPRVLHFDGKQ
jgi:hypothetical protein